MFIEVILKNRSRKFSLQNCFFQRQMIRERLRVNTGHIKLVNEERVYYYFCSYTSYCHLSKKFCIITLSFFFLFSAFSPFIYTFFVQVSPARMSVTLQEDIFMTDMYSKCAHFKKRAVKGLPHLTPCSPPCLISVKNRYLKSRAATSFTVMVLCFFLTFTVALRPN